MPKLTDLKVKSAKPKEKQYKLYDEHRLHLLVKQMGLSFGIGNIFLREKKKFILSASILK